MDHTFPTRNEHRNSYIASTSAEIEIGANSGTLPSYLQLQQPETYSHVKGAETMATVHAQDLKLEVSSLHNWGSELPSIHENFMDPHFPNYHHRASPSVEGLQPPPKGGGGVPGPVSSISFSQQSRVLDMPQIPLHHHHHSRTSTIPSGVYMHLDSITSPLVGGGHFNPCYGDITRAKKQRLSPHPSFYSPQGLTTIRDSLPSIPAGRSRGRAGPAGGGAGDEVRRLECGHSGSSNKRVRNEQGLNEVLQRFKTSPIVPQVQSNMGVKISNPFDSVGLSGIPASPSSSPSPEAETSNVRQQREGAPGTWPINPKRVTTMPIINSVVHAHDADTLQKLLVDCAQAFENKDILAAQKLLRHLESVAPADGNLNQRIASCFVKALARRHSYPIRTTEGRMQRSKNFSAVDYAGMIDTTPWYRFGFKAANAVMMESFEGKDKVHIIDFSINYGMQWPTLIDSLSERADGPPNVRLTVHKLRPNTPPYMDMPQEMVAKKLTQFASTKNVNLEVNFIEHDIHLLDRSLFDIRDDEATIVNCMYRARYVPDESADPPNCQRDAFLRLIYSLDPSLVIIVDEEATLTSQNWVTRMKATLDYIWIPFDVVDTFLTGESPQRLEHEFDLEMKIDNIVACEGLHRIERLESKDKWEQRMKRAGFEIVPFSDEVNSDVRSMLTDHAGGWGMKQEDDALLLTWKGHNVLFATAWQPSFHMRDLS